MQEHYRLADGISEDEANLVFNNAAWKVIKNAFKHARCICVATYYACVEVIDFFTLTCKCNCFLHVGVEAADEAHRGPRDLSD
jgi:hypothetical protein